MPQNVCPPRGGAATRALLPNVHRVASLAKRWLLGTHQGSFEVTCRELPRRVRVPLQRRTSRSRGLVFHRVLELAVGHDPVRYRDLVVDPQPKRKPAAGRVRLGPSAVSRAASGDPTQDNA